MLRGALDEARVVGLDDGTERALGLDGARAGGKTAAGGGGGAGT